MTFDAILHNRNFRLYAGGQGFSQAGSMMTKIALPLFVLKATGSAAAFSTVLALGFIPTFFLYPFAGAWVDRLDRRRLLVALDWARGLFLATLVILQFAMDPGLWVVIAYVVFNAVCDAFAQPLSNTIIPFLFNEEHFDLANSANAWVVNAAGIVAPPLGVWLFSVLGLRGILAIDAGTFLVGGACSSQLRLLHRGLVFAAMPTFHLVKEGMRLLSRRELLLPTLAVCVSRAFIDPIYTLAIPFLLITILRLTSYAISVTSASMILGLLCAPLLVARLRMRYGTLQSLQWSRSGKILIFLIYSIGGWWVVRAPGSQPSWVPIVLFAFICFGGVFFNAAGFAFLNTHFQKTVPNEIMGRFAASRFMAYAIAQPLGLKLYGLILDRERFALAFSLAAVAAIVETLLLHSLSGRKT